MSLLDRLTMRHITLGVIFTCFGIFIRGGLVGVIGGVILGLTIAEITYMFDALGKK